MVELCKERVSTGSYLNPSRPCQRPAKTDGLCGIHAAAKRKRDATDAKWRQEWANRDENKAAAEPIRKRFEELTGTEAFNNSSATGMFINVEAAALQKLMERVEHET